MFIDFNKALTKYFSNQDFLKINMEYLGLTWFELG